jgi:hypothetical protein
VEINKLEGLAIAIGIPDVTPVPDQKIRLPTDANSEFLANRGLGDWAEQIVAQLVRKAGLIPVAYGDDNSLAAGEDGFREMYLRNRTGLWTHGKRPDILVFEPNTHDELGLRGSLRGFPEEDELRIVPRALAGLEVRGSKFRAKKYREVRATENQGGASPDQEQCFTPKVEDLSLVLHWVKRYRVRHFYAQVFLDEVHLISFGEILQILTAREKLAPRKTKGEASVDGFDPIRLRKVRIEEPPNSNGKRTYFIPLSFGKLAAEIPNWETGKPSFQSQMRESRLGRLDSYVVPVGGSFDLAGTTFRESILSSP